MNSVKANIWIHVQYPTLGKPLVDKVTKALPWHAVSLTPTAKHAEPQTGYLGAECFDTRKIARNSMEVHITLYNRTDPLTHLRDGIVESAPKLELHLMELETEPLGYRLSLDGKAPSLAVDSTDMSKAEEIKSLRLSQTLPFAACGSKFSKLEEPRLLRVQAETESAHPLFDVPEKPLSLRLVLKPEDKVIGVPNDNDIAPCVSPAPLIYPQIKDIVQVNIGKQGRDYRPLWGPHFSLGPSSFLHDSCAEPFSDKSQKSSVGNSMLKKLHEPSVFDGVEETADVCIEHPIDPPP